MGLGKTNAGFEYGSGPTTHRLGYILLDVHPAHRKARYVAESIDYSNREVFTIGSGVEEVSARIRFDSFGEGLLDMLESGADGTTLTYFPDIDAQFASYDMKLVDVGDEILINPDPSREGFGEKSVEVRLRSADGTPLWPLYTPLVFNGTGEENLIRDAAMDTDSDGDGVVDGFSSTTVGTGFGFSVVEAGAIGRDTQRISADGTGSDSDRAQVEQVVLRVLPGDQVTVSSQCWFSTAPTDAIGQVVLVFERADGANLSSSDVSFTDQDIQRRAVTATAPDGSVQLRVLYRLALTADGGDGAVRFSNARLLRASSDPSAYANPHVSGADQTGDSLDTAGWPADTTGVVSAGGVIRAGGSGATQSGADDVTHFFRAAEDVDSDPSGDATIPLTVDIGSGNAPADGAALRFHPPHF